MDRSAFVPKPAMASGDGPDWRRAAVERSACGIAERGVIRRGTLQRLSCSSFVLASFCLLAGCVDSYVAARTPEAPPPLQSTNMARRQGISPSGATVAMAGFVGGPDGVRDRYTIAFDDAAKAQDIVMADPKTANYFVRGYLNAVPEGEGTAVTYVLDMFDSKKHRTQRVEDQITIHAKAADPWSVVDDRILAAVAQKSAAALAAVLTNTPEAIAVAAQGKADAGGMTAAAGEDAGGRTVVAATPPVGPPGSASAAGGLGRVALH